MKKKRKTTVLGIIKGAAIGATLGTIIGLPLGYHLTGQPQKKLEVVIHEGAQQSLPYIAKFTAQDPQAFDVGIDPKTGEPGAIYMMREYELPEQFKRDFELSDYKATVGVLDIKPFYRDIGIFGEEDSLLIQAYDDLFFANISFRGIDYTNLEIHDSFGVETPTIDRVLLGVLNTIVETKQAEEAEKNKIMA